MYLLLSLPLPFKTAMENSSVGLELSFSSFRKISRRRKRDAKDSLRFSVKLLAKLREGDKEALPIAAPESFCSLLRNFQFYNPHKFS